MSTQPPANPSGTSTTSSGTAVAPSPALASNSSALQKVLAVLEAVEPLALAAAAPFIKNTGTQSIVVAESPVALALLEALKAL